ncbi:MAG: peptidoglycan editing factor PgeF [Novosphingobium sp.]
MADRVQVLRAGLLEAVPHGFLGRRGCISTGAVAGLNVGLGSGDDHAAVAENRARALAAVMPGAKLATVYQVHSPACVVVTEPWPADQRPHADAMVSNTPGVLLGIVTADCAPVLFADVEAGVIGAAHAGWKGALAGVTDRTIEAMIALGARADCIVAAVGPCIAQASYEVDLGFVQTFCHADASAMQFFAPGRSGHMQFDLEGYVAHRLEMAGIQPVEPLRQDTYALEDTYFSFRRATHRGEADYGRQFSLIGLA